MVETPWRPNGPVTVLIGFPLGGGSDIIGRPVLCELQKHWGLAINVENFPGENGVLAALDIVDAIPDGRTILLGHVSSNAIAPEVLKDIAVAASIKSLRPISRIASQAHVLVVNTSSPMHTLSEFVSHARDANEPLRYGSTGFGSMQQLVAEKFASRAGIQLTHVPYLGSMPAMADLRVGRIDCIFEGYVPAAPFIDDGVFRALALSAPTDEFELGIPSFDESGYADFEMRSWWGLFAPPHTSQDILDGWQAALSAALKNADIRNFAKSLGVELICEHSMTFEKMLLRERDLLSRITTDLNFGISSPTSLERIRSRTQRRYSNEKSIRL